MFTEKEIQLIRKIGITIDISQENSISDDEWVNLEEKIGEYLTLKCLDKNYNPNDEGLICESILDKINLE